MLTIKSLIHGPNVLHTSVPSPEHKYPNTEGGGTFKSASVHCCMQAVSAGVASVVLICEIEKGAKPVTEQCAGVDMISFMKGAVGVAPKFMPNANEVAVACVQRGRRSLSVDIK